MKKLSIFMILAGLALGFDSCADLEEVPPSSLTTLSLFKNEQDAEAAINGIYALLHGNSYWRFDEHWVVEVASMYGSERGAANIYKNGTLGSGHVRLTSLWKTRYDVINLCNFAIKYIPGIQMDAGKRNELVAEARWLRADVYFRLVRLFGNLPARTEPSESMEQAYIPFSSSADIYNNIIIPDLQFAEEHLPMGSAAPGRIRKGAAKFLLGKVYVSMARNRLVNDPSKLPMAKEKLRDLINNRAAYGYSLKPRYLDVFFLAEDLVTADFSKELNNELIFTIQQTRALSGHGTAIAFTLVPPRSYFTNAGTGGQHLFGWLPELYHSYEPFDERRDITLIYSYQRRGAPPGTMIIYGHPNVPPDLYNWGYEGGISMCQRKYIDPGQTIGTQGEPDIIIYRLAEAYLLLAEAENLMNGGPNAAVFDNLDVIRLRAKASPMDRTAAWTMESMNDFIFEERCKELTQEWHGVYDLRHFGKVEEAFNRGFLWSVGFSYDPKLELYPIPANEMSRNPYAVQNDGW